MKERKRTSNLEFEIFGIVNVKIEERQGQECTEGQSQEEL